MFLSKVWAHPSEVPFSCSTLGKLLALPTNIRLGWRWPNRTVKLLVPYLSYREKKKCCGDGIWRKWDFIVVRDFCWILLIFNGGWRWKSKMLGATPFCQLTTSSNAKRNTYRSHPGACIIKRITAVIYGFRNKLECLSLASLSSLI